LRNKETVDSILSGLGVLRASIVDKMPHRPEVLVGLDLAITMVAKEIELNPEAIKDDTDAHLF